MSGTGASGTCRPARCLPKPYQQPHPPIWVAALQPTTYQLAARKGIGVMALGVSAPSVLEPHIQNYRTTIKEADPVGRIRQQPVAQFHFWLLR